MLVGIAITFLAFVIFTSNVLALSENPPVQPLVLLDCGVIAVKPAKSGSYVVANGSITCASSHPSLKVVTGIKDVTGNRYTSVVKTCYNIAQCSVSAKLSYYSNRYWYTDVSGYQGTDWNAYTYSNTVLIP